MQLIKKDGGGKTEKSELDKLTPEKYKIVDTSNSTALLDPTNTTDAINVGSAVFLYEDSATGVRQKFAFSLRYYIAAGKSEQKANMTTYGLQELERRKASGLYDWKVNSTKHEQKSYSYGKVNMKRSRLRQNERSGEMLLLWEQQYGNASQVINATANSTNPLELREKYANGTEKLERIRASVRIDLNDIENFVKFHVSTNDVPVSADATGKDIVVDWHMLEGFDTDEKFWVDANGMQMVYKTLNKRAEYDFKDAATDSPYSVAANYYPMTSAIAVKDHGTSPN